MKGMKQTDNPLYLNFSPKLLHHKVFLKFHDRTLLKNTGEDSFFRLKNSYPE